VGGRTEVAVLPPPLPPQALTSARTQPKRHTCAARRAGDGGERESLISELRFVVDKYTNPQSRNARSAEPMCPGGHPAIYRTFVVPRDGNPALDQALDRDGPRRQEIAVALLVEPAKPKRGYQISSMNLLRPDGTYASVPGIGIILQSPFNFWDKLRRYEPNQVIHIKRTGTGLDTRFEMDSDDPPSSIPVPDTGLIDLDALIAKLSCPDRLERWLGELEHPTWQYLPRR
jgi:hypothetical protein